MSWMQQKSGALSTFHFHFLPWILSLRLHHRRPYLIVEGCRVCIRPKISADTTDVWKRHWQLVMFFFYFLWMINLLFKKSFSFIFLDPNLRPEPNFWQTQLGTSWWTKWNICQLKIQIFPSAVGRDQNRSLKRTNIALKFIRLAEVWFVTTGWIDEQHTLRGDITSVLSLQNHFLSVQKKVLSKWKINCILSHGCHVWSVTTISLIWKLLPC